MLEIPEDVKEAFQKLILEWSEENIIIYPWRKNRNPYKILISEILLTRTKAEQVVPVYIKFLEEFPSLKEFCEIKYEKIKELIKSLGLLYRAEKLNILKDQIINQFDGEIPNNFDDLKTLSGIGDYNANAILCFGFNERKPLLDTNFVRIYKRVFNITAKTKTPKTDKYLWNVAENFLPKKNYIDYNYGIIDFASKICTSRGPKCSICILNQNCKYFDKIKK